MVLKAVLLALIFCGSLAFADDDGEPRPVFGSHPGYLFNVGEEKTKRDVEMVMLDKPKPPPDSKKKRVLVDEKLTKEFQTQYQYRFGTTAAEQVINNPGRDSEYTYYNNHSVTTEQYQSYQRDFGNYMIRRLAEYHIDNWFKSDPDLKPIYEMKDKLSNVSVPMKKGYKLKFKYNLAGPSFEATLDNPYDIETRLQILMTGLLTPHEEILSLGYRLSPKVKIETLYRQYQQLTQLVLSRQITKHTSVSITGSTGQLPTDPNIHQNLALIGIGWAE
jgi:hypothetical protein